MPTSILLRNSGRRAIALSLVVGLMVMGLGWYFWVRGQMILREELRTQLQNTAGIASLLINPEVVLLLVVLLSIVVIALIQWDSVQRRMASAAYISDERSGLLQLTLHRLGTPLTIFKWSLESLGDCAVDKDCPIEEVHDHIRQMQQGIGSMEGIIKQLLEVEKVEDGMVTNNPQPTPVCRVIEATVQEVANEIKGRKQTISIEECQEATASIDPEILRGVLRELLHNASTFSPEGSEIRISSMGRRSHIVIAVKDRGCGVPASEQHRMFQKFGRASNAHLSDPNGAGLGLYICRHVIELAGGKIDLESEEGNGTTVTFSIPANERRETGG